MNVMQRFIGGLAVAALTVKNLTVTGSIANSGTNTNSISAGLTASTTHTIAGGTPLPSAINQLSTVANANDAATLAIGTVPGQSQEVYNDGAHVAAIYPPNSSVVIDGGSAGAAVALTNAKRCKYTCTALNVIESAQLGVPSA